MRARMDDDRRVSVVQVTTRDKCLGLRELEEQVVRRFSVATLKFTS
jgi:hypothetical protein